MNDSPPSKIKQLRATLLESLDPLRRRVFGDPEMILFLSDFVKIQQGTSLAGLLPSTASTNSDGTAAWLLTKAQRDSLQDRMSHVQGLTKMGSPAVATEERRKARVLVMQNVLVNGTNAPCGISMDVVGAVDGTNITLRAIAEVTEAVTNVTGRVGTFQTNVTVKTTFQAAFETIVPNDGGVIVWDKAFQIGGESYLLLLRPQVFTGPLGPPAPTPAPPTPKGGPPKKAD